MILPSKHLSQDRALLTIGARVLKHLRSSKTVSALWEELKHFDTTASGNARPLDYDSFVLCLDLLYAMRAVELKDGIIFRRNP